MNARAIGPTISVITPCLNGARYIGDAIESVLAQGYPNAQHIVADGGSTDGTLEMLGRYPHLRVLSSPDHGIYDALNRALAVAHGDLIGILNSDDCYADDAFSSGIEAFRDESVMALAGQAVTFGNAAADGPFVAVGFTPAGADMLYRATLGNPSINAWLFRAAVFAKIGRFDTSYRVAGDREFMLRFALSGLRYVATDKLICRYRVHPESMTFGGNEAIWETIRCEHERMTDLYLRKPGLPGRARHLLKRARTQDTLRAAIRAARQRNVRGLIAHAAAGTRHDLVWPARFAKRAICAMAVKCGFRPREDGAPR